MTAMLLQVADEEFCIVDCGFDLESVSGNAFVQYKALHIYSGYMCLLVKHQNRKLLFCSPFICANGDPA